MPIPFCPPPQLLLGRRHQFLCTVGHPHAFGGPGGSPQEKGWRLGDEMQPLLLSLERLLCVWIFERSSGRVGWIRPACPQCSGWEGSQVIPCWMWEFCQFPLQDTVDHWLRVLALYSFSMSKFTHFMLFSGCCVESSGCFVELLFY